MRDDVYMRHALELAARGRGRVEPNPLVGAVLVRGTQIVGEGWHEEVGSRHAEVAALEDARRRGGDGTGATMYVTLEPCDHHGRTPPCTQAVIDAGVARVVVAMIDPDPRVSGAGVRRLKEAGVAVAVGVCERAAHELNEPFTKRVTTGLPWVIVKWAQTLDGKIATASGDSQWISSDASRRRVHALRGRVDAIMVGINTVLADDPRLTARDVAAAAVHRHARRIVLDPRLRMPEDARLAHDDPRSLTLAVSQGLLDQGDARARQWEARGVSLVGLPVLGGGELDLEPLLRGLVEHHEATNVLVEGGSVLIGSLIAQGLADQVLAFVAPRITGDAGAIDAVRGLRCDTIAEAVGLRLRHVEQIDGGDVLLDYRLTTGSDEPGPGAGAPLIAP
ncbi:MAG: bifunctional diaminohydroxyphosphoribosylaminopyrimidine deaminase/5-amino-6-(5-phosphoribosylamino)uracil reductase RibD [Phycisphaeraceae bacterium]